MSDRSIANELHEKNKTNNPTPIFLLLSIAVRNEEIFFVHRPVLYTLHNGHPWPAEYRSATNHLGLRCIKDIF